MKLSGLFALLIALSAVPLLGQTPVSRPSLDDLKAVEAELVVLAAKLSRATVGLRIGGSQGSGVIVSEDGIILTAAHVFPKAGLDAVVIFPDGRKVDALTLGRHEVDDFGILKIKGDGTKWPFVEMGDSDALEVGDACLALGHPGGFQPGRTPPLRIGKVTSLRGRFLRTDCTINRGDSGGPLFAMDGRVIGIHSRINQRETSNYHIAVEKYRKNWDALLASKDWGEEGADFAKGKPAVGIEADRGANECRVNRVFKNSTASKAGLRVGDIILEFNDEPVSNIADVSRIKGALKIGDDTTMVIERRGEKLTLKLKMAGPPE